MAQHQPEHRKSTTALKQEIAELQAEVAILNEKLDKAARLSSPNRKMPRQRWNSRTIAAWLCLTAASALLIVGNIFFWAGNTVVDTNTYVATVGPLIQKPQIQAAIAEYTTTQIFNNTNVRAFVQQTLPPRASFLAPQLTSQLQNYTQSTIKTLLANKQVQQYWYSSLTRRHAALINFSKTYRGNGTIDVSDIYSQLSKRLETTKLAFLANKQLPSKVGSIQVTTVGWLPALHKLSNNIGLYQAFVTALFLVFCGLAGWLASNRRRMVIRMGIMFAVFMLLTLVSIRITRAILVARVQPAYQSAVQVAFDTVFSSLRSQTFTILLIGVLLSLIAWISGPYRSASFLKVRFSELFAGRLHQSIFGDQENRFTLWLGTYKRYSQWISVIIIAIIMLFIKLSPRLIIVFTILMLLCIIAIELFAAPSARSNETPIRPKN